MTKPLRPEDPRKRGGYTRPAASSGVASLLGNGFITGTVLHVDGGHRLI